MSDSHRLVTSHDGHVSMSQRRPPSNAPLLLQFIHLWEVQVSWDSFIHGASSSHPRVMFLIDHDTCGVSWSGSWW